PEAAPRGQRNQDQHGEEDRPEHAELRAQELQEMRRMQQWAAEMGIVAGMAIADEAVERVPDEIGRVDRQRDRRGAEEAFEMAALVAEQQQEQQSREQPVGHRILGEQAEAGGDADRDPPALAAGLTRADEG